MTVLGSSRKGYTVSRNSSWRTGNWPRRPGGGGIGRGIAGGASAAGLTAWGHPRLDTGGLIAMEWQAEVCATYIGRGGNQKFPARVPSAGHEHMCGLSSRTQRLLKINPTSECVGIAQAACTALLGTFRTSTRNVKVVRIPSSKLPSPKLSYEAALHRGSWMINHATGELPLIRSSLYLRRKPIHRTIGQ
ncbi:hypothetical protein PIB30_042593 [Stylosanthes scabra]|uniref:Uncharacterized protein n=1 Tax=Stylosanthes scabra TaxID=79078 RepID=A0ABU6UDX1_9FABA|nr:hypothetical protein [Stylosanthes scabra]